MPLSRDDDPFSGIFEFKDLQFIGNPQQSDTDNDHNDHGILCLVQSFLEEDPGQNDGEDTVRSNQRGGNDGVAGHGEHVEELPDRFKYGRIAFDALLEQVEPLFFHKTKVDEGQDGAGKKGEFIGKQGRILADQAQLIEINPVGKRAKSIDQSV